MSSEQTDTGYHDVPVETDELLNSADILGQDDLPVVAVPCPEWGGKKVYVRGLTAAEYDLYMQSLYPTATDPKDGKAKQSSNLANAKARLVVKGLVTKDGKRIFKDEDAKALGAKGSSVVLRLYQKIRDISGMNEEEKEVISKNSDSAGTENSP